MIKKHLIAIVFCFGVLFANAQTPPPLETIIQKGHLKYVTCTAFSPDGNYVLTGSLDNTVKLWNAQSGKEIRAFNRHTERLRSVTFSPDGKSILTASGDQTAVVFDVLTGKVKAVIDNKAVTTDYLRKAIFSPDGSKILTMTHRNEIFVYDAQTGELIGTHAKEFAATIHPLWFSPDGSKLLRYHKYDKAKIVDPTTGKTLDSLVFDKTLSMSFSPNGKYVALGSSKLFAHIFDAETGKDLHQLKIDEAKKCDGCKTRIAFSNNSKYLATGTGEQYGIALWDVAKGSKLTTYKVAKGERINYILFSPNDKYVMVGNDKYIYAFDAHSGAKRFELKSEFISYYTPSFSPNSKYILVPGANNTTEMWDVGSKRKARTFQGYLNHTRDDGLKFSYQRWDQAGILKYISRKSNIALSSDGVDLLKGNVDSVAVIMDTYTGKVKREFRGHSKVVIAADFSPDGKHMVTGSGDWTLKLWEVETGKEIRTYKGHRELIFDVKFSSDGKYIASGSWDGLLRIWETETGKEVQYIKMDKASPYSIRFTPNDLYVVTGDLGEKLKMWEVDSGEEFRTYVGHTDVTASMDFSPDGKTMVTGSWDGKVKVWDVLTGMQLRKFTSHKGGVNAVAYDTNGEFIVSGSSDRTIKFWDTKTGKEIATLTGHSSAIASLQLRSDSEYLFSCSVDGVVKRWDLQTMKEQYTYIQIARNEWLAKNPAGYFDGSAKALKLVNYVSGMDVVAVGSLFEKYYTPGLIKRITDGEKFDETGQNINEMIKATPGVDITLYDSKKRAIDTQSDSIYRWKTPVMPITVNFSDEGEGIDEVRVYNNGKLIFNESLSSAPVFRGGTKTSREYEIKLTDGTNKISAIVVNEKRTESYPAAVEVIYSGEAAKIDLYVVTIGINKYKNPAYELNYAINDAKSFLKTVKKGADTLFNRVQEHFIKDSDANKENISTIIAGIEKEIGPEDVFLFYYAGHGVMSEDKKKQSDFYIVSYDVTNLYDDNEKIKAKAISASELMEFSRKIAAEKQLFIIDACHSGGALSAFATRGVAREKALAQLARSTGTFFLTASQDAQYANEVGSLEHGLFTYAIMEALQGKADSGSDDKVTVNELKSYVEDRVPELSEKYKGSPQYPTSYSFGQDFPIVIVK
jgi:WD40 repeat protein